MSKRRRDPAGAPVSMRLEPDLFAALERYCGERNVSRSLALNDALRTFLSPEDETAQLQLVANSLHRLDAKVELLRELLGLFVQQWLIHTPPIPTGQRKAAASQGLARFERFATEIDKAVTRGRSVLDLPSTSAKTGEESLDAA